MLAATHDRYGQPDVIRLVDRPVPEPGPGEVLVAVKATSINSWDWDNLRGAPFARAFSPRKPPVEVPGIDVAGVVESVGDGVSLHQPGDEVYGDISSTGMGAMAEFATTTASMLAAKPSTLTFEQAASLPHAGVLALQGFDKTEVERGKRLLINGAGGGIGPIALQLAKNNGVETVAVDRAEKFEMMRRLGATELVDYRADRFYDVVDPSDGVIDVISHQSLRAARQALSPGGRYVTVGGTVRSLISLGVWGSLVSRVSDKKVGILMHRPGREPLERVTQLIESGAIRPVVDEVFSIRDVVEAYGYFGTGLYQGKVVISID